MLVDLVPNRALLAEAMRAVGKKHGIDLELSSRPSGSLEAIERIDQPNPIDVALAPGGIGLREYPNVRQVLTLGVESLHVLVRAELADGGVAGLRGRRINVGPPTASCHYLARDLLAYAGLQGPAAPDARTRGDYHAEEASPQELERQLARLREAGEADRDGANRALPDAVVILSALPSRLAHLLVTTAGYRLMPLPFADAYCVDRARPRNASGAWIDRTQLFVTEIPAYLYGIDPPVPAAPCRTIATRLILLAYAESDPEAVARLAETMYDSALANLGDPVPLGDQVPRFPLHHGTQLYRRRSQPLLSPERAGNLGALGGVLGAFALGAVVTYCFFRFRQLRRFEGYYHEMRRVEMIARGRKVDPRAPTDPAQLRRYLEDQLIALKSKVFRDFAEGNLRGESLLSGIISLVNDTRNSLERMTPLDEPATPGATPTGKLPSGKDAPDARN
jgi:hypothetical protein